MVHRLAPDGREQFRGAGADRLDLGERASLPAGVAVAPGPIVAGAVRTRPRSDGNNVDIKFS